MGWKCLSMVVFAVSVSLALTLLGCGHDQQLVSIDIQPSVETFGAANIPVIANAGANVQLKAYGNYIHPPVRKDITDKAKWFSNTPDMVTVNATGLITATGLACGGTLVTATVQTNSSAGGLSSSGAVVTGTMTANVVCFTGTGGGSGPLLTVNFAGAGAGTVTSSPSGINCATTNGSCTASFASGTPVTLTATPVSSTFSGWSGGCVSSSPTCTFTIQSNATVTATFN